MHLYFVSHHPFSSISGRQRSSSAHSWIMMTTRSFKRSLNSELEHPDPDQKSSLNLTDTQVFLPQVPAQASSTLPLGKTEMQRRVFSVSHVPSRFRGRGEEASVRSLPLEREFSQDFSCSRSGLSPPGAPGTPLPRCSGCSSHQAGGASCPSPFSPDFPIVPSM